MAYIQKRKNPGGSISFVAFVKVAPFSTPAKAFPKRSEAVAWASDKEHELKRQRVKGSTGRTRYRPQADLRRDIGKLTVNDLIVEFLADPQHQLKKAFADLKRHCDWWRDELATERLSELNALSVRACRDKLRSRAKPLSNASINRYLAAMRSAFNWGIAAGFIPADRAWPKRLMMPEPPGRTRYLTAVETAALRDACKEDPIMNAAIVVSLSTGMRQGELLRLEWADIDFDRATVVVRIAKNKTPRAMHLGPPALAALRAIEPEQPLMSAPVLGFGFGQNQLLNRWEHIRKAAGLVDFRWHDLRHSCASFLAQNGTTLLQIGAVLGHKSPGTTARYAHLVDGVEMPGHAAINKLLQ